MIGLKLVLVIALCRVFVQDTRERYVDAFLFPVIGICGGLLHYAEVSSLSYATSSLSNIILLGLMLVVLFVYTKYRLKARLLTVIGLGDLLFFLIFSMSFSVRSFIVLFSASLVCSLALHCALKKPSKCSTVPLAGYMSLFLITMYLISWIGSDPSLLYGII